MTVSNRVTEKSTSWNENDKKLFMKSNSIELKCSILLCVSGLLENCMFERKCERTAMKKILFFSFLE